MRAKTIPRMRRIRIDKIKYNYITGWKDGDKEGLFHRIILKGEIKPCWRHGKKNATQKAIYIYMYIVDPGSMQKGI